MKIKFDGEEEEISASITHTSVLTDLEVEKSPDNSYTMCVLHSMAVFLSKSEKKIFGVDLSNPELSHLYIPISHKVNEYEPLEIVCPSNSGQYV